MQFFCPAPVPKPIEDEAASDTLSQASSEALYRRHYDDDVTSVTYGPGTPAASTTRTPPVSCLRAVATCILACTGASLGTSDSDQASSVSLNTPADAADDADATTDGARSSTARKRHTSRTTAAGSESAAAAPSAGTMFATARQYSKFARSVLVKQYSHSRRRQRSGDGSKFVKRGTSRTRSSIEMTSTSSGLGSSGVRSSVHSRRPSSAGKSSSAATPYDSGVDSPAGTAMYTFTYFFNVF